MVVIKKRFNLLRRDNNQPKQDNNHTKRYFKDRLVLLQHVMRPFWNNLDVHLWNSSYSPLISQSNSYDWVWMPDNTNWHIWLGQDAVGIKSWLTNYCCLIVHSASDRYQKLDLFPILQTKYFNLSNLEWQIIAGRQLLGPDSPQRDRMVRGWWLN